MIRGAIEIAQKTRIAGWIYSACEPLRGKTLLAFVGDRCVGAGEVDGFRQDLLDAKLGDGFCGFDFPVRLADDETVGGLIVRLQFCDSALLQQTSRIIGADETDGADALPRLGAILPGNVAWMMDRGMVEQHEYDFLKAIHTAGAYERGLLVGRRVAGEPAKRVEPETIVQDLLGLMMMTDVRVSRASLAGISDLGAPPAGAAPVFALWSKERARISLEERSHLLGRRASPSVLRDAPPGGIDYSFGPDRVLFVHRDCAFSARGPAPASGVMVFTASAPVAGVAETNVRKIRVA